MRPVRRRTVTHVEAQELSLEMLKTRKLTETITLRNYLLLAELDGIFSFSKII